jgi:hypothetical protein
MTGAFGSWDAERVLRAMFVAQCGLAVLVAAGDLPAALFSALDAPPQAPQTDIPVAPGDQTRRFDPRRLPTDRPAAPGFPRDETVPPQLTFQTAEIGDLTGVLLVTGEIAEGDARRFAAHLEGLAEPPTVIALHSPGGLVHEALDIGRQVRAAGLPTAVLSGASCFSACPYILAGGTDRTVSGAGRVGVHQHYFDENTYLPAFLAVSDIQAGQAEVMAFLNGMGIDPMLMEKALLTRPDDIYILLPEELTGFRLATDLTD